MGWNDLARRNLEKHRKGTGLTGISGNDEHLNALRERQRGGNWLKLYLVRIDDQIFRTTSNTARLSGTGWQAGGFFSTGPKLAAR